MKILLTSNASHDPPRGGSTRSNLIWLSSLAGNGHQCRVVASWESPPPNAEDLRDSTVNKIDIRSVRDLSVRTGILTEAIRHSSPDWLLVSSEDLSHVLLRTAAKAAPDRLVYLAHTPQFFPFGPASWNPDPAATAIVQRAAAVVAIGHHTARYIETHTGRKPVVIHPPIYGHPPYRQLGAFDRDWVLMINPCAVKGIGIFLALADRFPQHTFAALRGWGTTHVDEAALARRPNCRLLENVPDIETVLSNARALLMPSLWYEGFGLIAMEAMLRGVPVIASNSGGLEECMQGSPYVLPVNLIESYEPVCDETHLPRPRIAPQNIEPWAVALNTLLTSRAAWEQEAERSREAASRFIETLDLRDLERMLLALQPVALETAAAAAPTPAPALESLSAEKRALLLKRLRKT